MLCLSATLLTTACAPTAPLLTAPKSTLPAQWPGSAVPATSTSSDLPPWQSMVLDPYLQQLLQQASLYNHDLRLALLRAEEAQASYGIQRAERLPTLGVGSTHGRARVPGDLNVSGRSVLGSDHEVFVGLNSWELDLWGRVRNLSTAALQQYLATQAGALAARQALLARWHAATWCCANWTNAWP